VHDDRPTDAKITAMLTRLALAFGRQKEHDGSSATNVVRVYREAVSDLPMPAIEQGVERIIREDKYWPRPSRLRSAALPFVPRVPEQDRQLPDHPTCPQGHRLEPRSYTNANGRLIGDRWWCPCETRGAELYGTTWGAPTSQARGRAA